MLEIHWLYERVGLNHLDTIHFNTLQYMDITQKHLELFTIINTLLIYYD